MSKKGIRGLISAAGVFCILMGCIAVAGYQEKLHAEGDQVVSRGVIDSLGQIPTYKKENYDANRNIRDELGKSKDNPLLILEIVPDEAYAEFGYLISGCEPIAVEEMFGQEIGGLDSDIGTDVVTTTQTSATFFAEEPQAQPSAYQNVSELEKNTQYDVGFKGFYERVQEGKGTFVQDDEGNIIKVDSGKGNIIWHTICEPEMPEYEDYFDTEQSDEKQALTNVGDRIYTTRVNTIEDQAYITPSGKFYYYKNHDVLLRNSLGCSEESAKDFNIVIKTITPKELNEDPEWADYADLFVVSPKSHDKKYIEWYDKFSRKVANRNTGKTHDVDNFVNTEVDKDRDLSWSVIRNMFDRIADTEGNFAAIIMDDGVYDFNNLSGSVKNGGTINLYDWNLTETEKTFNVGSKSNNNLYKLSVMLFSMKPSLFQSLYLNPDGPNGELIDSNGKFLLRKSDDDEYWSMYTFALVGDDYSDQAYGYSMEKYWNEQWERDTYGNITVDRVKVNGHVFTYNGDMSITQCFMTESIDTSGEKYDDFKEWLKNHPKEGEEAKQKVEPSEAVRYILQVGDKGSGQTGKGLLKILDIEPCYDSKNGYSLKETYIRMMIPDYTGDIQIKHMTTAEFIGSAEDLNSTYDMIFMGLDYGAYNITKTSLQDPDTGSWIEGYYTDWNDNNMDGKIYFHTGDSLYWGRHNGSGENRRVDFLWRVGSETKEAGAVSGYNLRFPGNDITTLKKTELENFLAAGYPIVAVPYLYNMDKTRIDQYSHICNFIKENRENKSLYVSTDTAKIEEAVRNGKPGVEFTKLPEIYDGATNGSSSATISDPNYLERDSLGRSLLRFKFLVKNPAGKEYKCRIYIDQNQDGKFANEELFYTGRKFSEGEQSVTVKLSKLYMGLMQWKIEVYQVGNEKIRFVKTGCSAAKNITGDKKQIDVLQIMPDNPKYGGALNLKTNDLFKKYYDSLDDYRISMSTMKVSEFQALFINHKFVFDYSKDITYEGTSLNPSPLSKEQSKLFDDYDMLIIGFDDMYGQTDLHNDYGAVDFIKYFVAEGKGVLFTHDLTSMNTSKEEASTWFGFSANMLMRDVMGMNRYKAVSNRIDETERNKIIGYQSKYHYDTVTDINGNELDEKHGYTYYCLRRLGVDVTDMQMPYRTLTLNGSKGFSDNNDPTSQVTQINEGQVTQYPYKIDPIFNVAETHGQYYQVNVEDPEVTVWYCLSGKNVYDLSPNDAANNYYIFSKENIFYSGVGHKTVTGDMEAKLFINTMIAAYRASYEPPMVEVLNPEAELKDINDLSYQMSFAQEYNDTAEEADNEEMVKIYFSPEELNAISSKLDCAIYYDVNGTKKYIDVIYEKDTDQPIYPTRDENGQLKLDGDGNPYFEDLKNMDEYYFLYPEKYLNEWKDTDGSTQPARRDIVFKIKNDRVKKPRYTTLKMSVRALFLLD